MSSVARLRKSSKDSNPESVKISNPEDEVRIQIKWRENQDVMQY